MTDTLYRWVQTTKETFPEEYGAHHFRWAETKNRLSSALAYAWAVIKQKPETVEMLEPVPSPGDNQSLEEAANKYADSQGVVEGDDYMSLTSSSLRQGLKAAYLAGLQRHAPAVGGDVQQRAKEYSDVILEKWGNKSPESEKNFDEEVFQAFLADAAYLKPDLDEAITHVNTLGNMQSESMGWVVEGEKEIKRLKKENEELQLAVEIRDAMLNSNKVSQDYDKGGKSKDSKIAHDVAQLKSPSRPSIDIVDRLRANNPWAGVHLNVTKSVIWDRCCDKLQELLNQSK